MGGGTLAEVRVLWVRYLDHASFERTTEPVGPVICEAVGVLEEDALLFYKLVSLQEGEDRSGMVILKADVLRARVIARWWDDG